MKFELKNLGLRKRTTAIIEWPFDLAAAVEQLVNWSIFLKSCDVKKTEEWLGFWYMETYGDGSSETAFQIESTTGKNSSSGGAALCKSVVTLPEPNMEASREVTVMITELLKMNRKKEEVAEIVRDREKTGQIPVMDSNCFLNY
ncbi:Guanine Nucleotide-Binding Protein G(Q) Subunit Alpha [Manis pentadactyla]|nr:Guanine Nucleotide-Binding Protein G(Q) Subunit Alpha [Manis pentadactyla]